eukprot:c6751_g1_i1 orf=18-233(-)
MTCLWLQGHLCELQLVTLLIALLMDPHLTFCVFMTTTNPLCSMQVMTMPVIQSKKKTRGVSLLYEASWPLA